MGKGVRDAVLVPVACHLLDDDDAPLGWDTDLNVGCRVKRAVRLGLGSGLGRREQNPRTPQPG